MSLIALWASLNGYALAAELAQPLTFNDRFGHWTATYVAIWQPTSMIRSYPYSVTSLAYTLKDKTK